MSIRRHSKQSSSLSSKEEDSFDSLGISFDFSSDDDSLSSASSDEEGYFPSEHKVNRDTLKCPPAPLLRYESPPETPTYDVTLLPGTPSIGGLRAQRPLMKLDLSSLPSPFRPDTSRLSASSPRPSLISRFSSSDDGSPVRGNESLTPGTENAWSAFGIAAGRRSPAGGLLASPQPTPPLLRGSRHRRYVMDTFGSPVEGDESERRARSSPRPPTSPLQHLCAQAAPLPEDDSDDEPAAAVTRLPTPLVDFRQAKAIVHSLLPGNHDLLADGTTPALSMSADSYFAVRR